MLPVGGDYTPPNKWITDVHHDWARRYVWPRFVCSLPRDFFAAVRAELAERGEEPTPQTRDMNPIYTGKDVSYIDTKQAQRAAEAAALEAEPFAAFATLLAGIAYPDAALAKAWVQLAYGAHHDAITGSESDQVYLDLLTSWRDAHDLAADVRDDALAVLSARVAAPGDGRPVVVWNSLNHPRTDLGDGPARRAAARGGRHRRRGRAGCPRSSSTAATRSRSARPGCRRSAGAPTASSPPSATTRAGSRPTA